MENMRQKTPYKRRIGNKVVQLEMSHNGYTVNLPRVRVTEEMKRKIDEHLMRSGKTISEFQRELMLGFFDKAHNS